MLMSVFHNWLLEIACENYFVYIKRLSANDTGATGGHQVGLYRGLTLSGTKTHVKQRFLPLTPLLMVSDVLWSPVLPA